MTAFRAFFATSGAASNEARELLWEHTIYQVVRLLQEAERRIRSPDGKARYSALAGWWRNSKVRLSGRANAKIPAEPALSEALVEEIESFIEEIILKTAPANDLINLDSLQFSLEAPRRRKKGIGTHAKPTDIRVYRLGSEIIDLRIEAKVLVKEGDIAKSYLSNQGIKRFSDPDEPYTDHEIGGMLAYTVSDDRSMWLGKIGTALGAGTTPIPTFKHRVHTASDEMLFCRVPYAPRQQGTRNEVLVFHVVLEFDSDPPSR